MKHTKLFFPVMLFFTWSIVDLQCCVNFCKKISFYTYMCVYTLFLCVWLYIYIYIAPGKSHRWDKAMAAHSSTLAWKIPWTKEPSRLQSMGLLGVGHNWAASPSIFTFMHWRRKWQPAPVFLLGESQGQGSLVDCRLWGHTESDTTEVT